MANRNKDAELTAHKLGQKAARRMALLSATVPYDQVDDTHYRECEFLDIAVDNMAECLSLACSRGRSRFEAAVRNALVEETDRILSLIAKGSPSFQ